MPFTFSHPAVMAPVRAFPQLARYVPLLVIGSMSPDFEYFLRLRIYSVYSHTMLGLLLFCVPISLLVYYIYEYCVAPQLSKYFCTTSYRSRSLITTTSTLLYSVGAIVIGALSHIIWDSFTHLTGYFVVRYPDFFQHTIASIPVFKIFQHGSTLVGGTIVLWWIYRSLDRTKLHMINLFGNTVLLLTTISLLVAVLLHSTPIPIGQFVIYGITFGAYAMVVVAAIGQIFNYIKRSKV